MYIYNNLLKFINQKNYRILLITSVFPRFFKREGREFHAMFWYNFSIFPPDASATAKKKLQATTYYKVTLRKTERIFVREDFILCFGTIFFQFFPPTSHTAG